MGAIVSSLAFPNPPRDMSAFALRSEPGLVWLTAQPSGLRIPAVYVTAQRDSSLNPQQRNRQRPVLLYSHGNAEDLGIILPYLELLANLTQCDVFGYEYPGYSISQGHKASEALCYQAIQAAYNHLIQDRRVNNIIAFGRSLGSGPTVHLCATAPAALLGCILQSPLTSAIRCVLDACTATALYPLDIFCNAQKVQRIPCPVLIIHGLQDTVVPPSHGKELYQLLQQRIDAQQFHYNPVWVPGRGHNDMPEQYCLKHCRQFVDWLLHEQDDACQTEGNAVRV